MCQFVGHLSFYYSLRDNNATLMYQEENTMKY